jgi:hypothetical protein
MNRAGHRAPELASCAERSTPISLTLRAGHVCPLILATALVPLIGYDKASQIVHRALEKDLTLSGDRIVDPRKMTAPYVTSASADIVHAAVSTRRTHDLEHTCRRLCDIAQPPD